MLSRVQQLKQVYILKTFDESKIRTSGIALRETERLASISMNKNPTPWHKEGSKDTIKVVSLNCDGLKPHYEDILSDTTIQIGDIIHIIETSLELNEVGNGKGIATYYKAGIFTNKQDYITPTIQITKFCSNNLDVINVYRSSNSKYVNSNSWGLQHLLLKKPK